MMRFARPRLAEVPLADLLSVKASVKASVGASVGASVEAHDDLDIVQAAPDERTAINVIYSL